jgi:hypothetical protein
VPVAYLGKYHAQFNFLGRLRAPIDILEPGELGDWLAQHPQGRVIRVTRAPRRDPAPELEFEQPYRGAWMQIWAGHPEN